MRTYNLFPSYFIHRHVYNIPTKVGACDTLIIIIVVSFTKLG